MRGAQRRRLFAKLHDRFHDITTYYFHNTPYDRVWLNPIRKEEWEHTYGRWTIARIADILHMEVMTLRGMVEFMNQRDATA